MKQLAILIFLLFLVGCGNEKNGGDPKGDAVHKSSHETDYNANKSNDLQVYSDEIKISLSDEIVIKDNNDGIFTNPRFSADGTKLFFTNNTFSQVWIYDLLTKKGIQISALQGCGYKYSIVENGEFIYFRNKAKIKNSNTKINSIIAQKAGNSDHKVIFATQKSLSVPVLIKNILFFSIDDSVKCYDLSRQEFLANSDQPYIYLNNNKLYKMKYGKLFPLFKDRNDFVDVQYSADQKYIKILTKNSGIEILDTEGNFINSYEGAITLSILPKSNLLAFNKESDNGVRIENSDLYFGFLNSTKNIMLNTKNEKRFHPSLSAAENILAYSTEDGLIKIASINIEKN
jgi:hypothetical protein